LYAVDVSSRADDRPAQSPCPLCDDTGWKPEGDGIGPASPAESRRGEISALAVTSRLQQEQLRVTPTCREQLVMRAQLDDLSIA
jgi:hypothetical protein